MTRSTHCFYYFFTRQPLHPHTPQTPQLAADATAIDRESACRRRKRAQPGVAHLPPRAASRRSLITTRARSEVEGHAAGDGLGHVEAREPAVLELRDEALLVLGLGDRPTPPCSPDRRSGWAAPSGREDFCNRWRCCSPVRHRGSHFSSSCGLGWSTKRSCGVKWVASRPQEAHGPVRSRGSGSTRVLCHPYLARGARRLFDTKEIKFHKHAAHLVAW